MSEDKYTEEEINKKLKEIKTEEDLEEFTKSYLGIKYIVNLSIKTFLDSVKNKQIKIL